MSKLLKNIAAPVTIVLLASACAGGSANAPFDGEGAHPNGPLMVQVRNNNWSDAVIWAVHGGTRFRLGEVASQEQRSLEVPKGVITGTGQIGVLVSLIGSRGRFATGNMSVYPGQVIDLQVQNHLAVSSWSVY